jgi:hypothetical protein
VKFIDKWKEFFYNKFVTLLPLALYLDEFVYLISHERLIEYVADRAILHKYLIKVKNCKENSRPDCDDLCKEFNINKFTYLIDGEYRLIKGFIKKFKDPSKQLQDENLFSELFNKR